MKHIISRALAVLTAGVLLLPCGCSRGEDTGAGYLFTVMLPDNPDCLDPQFTDHPQALAVLPNMTEGLLRLDADGEPVCGEAESYDISEDGLTYTFTLRDDCYWYGKNTDPDRPERVTARDYVFAFRRLLDPATRSPYAQEYLSIRNAQAVLREGADTQTLGVTAPDATTVIFELEYPDPEFLPLLAQSCAVPCNEEFFLSTNGRYGLDEDTVLCNGAFCLQKWNYDKYGSGNFLTMRKSRLYHDAENVYPSSLQFNIEHGRTDAEAVYAEGGADIMATGHYPKTYLQSHSYEVQAVRAVTLGLIFNPDNENLKNDELRQALACGIDRSRLEPLLSEDLETASGCIPPGITLLGRSYREMLADEPLSPAYDPVQAAQLFDKAAALLNLNTMNTMQIMVPSSIQDTEALLAVCQEWQNIFGYYIGIETVSPDEYDRRLAAGEYAIALYGITPQRNSPYAALEAYTAAAKLTGMTSGDLQTLMQQLRQTQQLSESVAVCGEAERAILRTHCFIPLFYKNSYLISTAGNQDIRYNPFGGAIDLREAKHFS